MPKPNKLSKRDRSFDPPVELIYSQELKIFDYINKAVAGRENKNAKARKTIKKRPNNKL